MADAASESFFDEGVEFDPLQADDYAIDQENMDDDNPLDTVDYPTMRNMPEHMQREAVYTPEVQGSAEAAIEALFDRNPGRRPVLMKIIDVCRDGCASSVIAEYVDRMQQDNLSVYAPMTLCRMLQRAGALALEEPDVADEREDKEEGVEYLEIKDEPDPIWTSTPAGLSAFDEHSQGREFKEIMRRDGAYSDVYQAVMQLVAEAPRSREEIEQLVDTFDSVKSPRRFGGHFIDMLEKTDILAWHDHAWQLTELGRIMLVDGQMPAIEQRA